MSSPIRLLVNGASGRMGRAVSRLAAIDPRFELVAVVSRSGAAPAEGVPAFESAQLRDCPDFDVAIDFSLPPGLEALIVACEARGAALVSGTTGLDPSLRARMAQAAAAIPLLWASNFSMGIVLLEELLRRATCAVPWPVSITEIHHVHKLDAPSGTAITLAAAAARTQGSTPPIESIREGEVVGTHRIRLDGPGEALELGHVASDRDIFARGALEAAQRLVGRPPGRWSLPELLFPAKSAD